MGGKAKIAKWIRNHILEIADEYRGMRLTYVEPFMGSGAVLEQIVKTGRFARFIANDIHPDLIRMWYALSRENWKPPIYIDKNEHQRLKNSRVSSALRGYAGFCCSFGGSFFTGYEYRFKETRGSQDIERRSVLRIGPTFRDVELNNVDYAELTIPPGSIIYCDPPYIGTTGYSNGDFDHVRFWKTVDGWVSTGSIVLVSEYQGPWPVLDEITIHSKLAHSFGDRRLERLFMRRP